MNAVFFLTVTSKGNQGENVAFFYNLDDSISEREYDSFSLVTCRHSWENMSNNKNDSDSSHLLKALLNRE